MRTKGLGGEFGCGGRWWGLTERRKLDTGGAGVGVGVAEEHRRWGWFRGGRGVGAGGSVGGPCGVFCMGRIRDEEEEGLGDVGSSSNRLKW